MNKKEKTRKTGQTKIKQQDPGLGEIAEKNISECHAHIKQATASYTNKDCFVVEKNFIGNDPWKHAMI